MSGDELFHIDRHGQGGLAALHLAALNFSQDRSAPEQHPGHDIIHHDLTGDSQSGQHKQHVGPAPGGHAAAGPRDSLRSALRTQCIITATSAGSIQTSLTTRSTNSPDQIDTIYADGEKSKDTAYTKIVRQTGYYHEPMAKAKGSLSLRSIVKLNLMEEATNVEKARKDRECAIQMGFSQKELDHMRTDISSSYAQKLHETKHAEGCICSALGDILSCSSQSTADEGLENDSSSTASLGSLESTTPAESDPFIPINGHSKEPDAVPVANGQMAEANDQANSVDGSMTVAVNADAATTPVAIADETDLDDLDLDVQTDAAATDDDCFDLGLGTPFGRNDSAADEQIDCGILSETAEYVNDTAVKSGEDLTAQKNASEDTDMFEDMDDLLQDHGEDPSQGHGEERGEERAKVPSMTSITGTLDGLDMIRRCLGGDYCQKASQEQQPELMAERGVVLSISGMHTLDTLEAPSRHERIDFSIVWYEFPLVEAQRANTKTTKTSHPCDVPHSGDQFEPLLVKRPMDFLRGIRDLIFGRAVVSEQADVDVQHATTTPAVISHTETRPRRKSSDRIYQEGSAEDFITALQDAVESEMERKDKEEEVKGLEQKRSDKRRRRQRPNRQKSPSTNVDKIWNSFSPSPNKNRNRKFLAEDAAKGDLSSYTGGDDELRAYLLLRTPPPPHNVGAWDSRDGTL
ncbi:uncharacterized protein MYCFIDRAFT_170930 [Pseudocercospora fijiensis CIRAD86]|uniref:Uncharacterized protein n=1 Tax=Pseudocercospora fijiensis (strain CIRAD86) TaxID=383855 RepID=N1QCK7_PSEFD|nr:uncharacterized protein MYCFIDRAFT_170930 [Pseudocercospora fijiensis CIRAD86]EME89467.1 hypothetical protein MYCFIDRAFT_170930 [Pseudocercospora fijiensis CIRAD86]